MFARFNRWRKSLRENDTEQEEVNVLVCPDEKLVDGKTYNVEHVSREDISVVCPRAESEPCTFNDSHAYKWYTIKYLTATINVNT